jgi:hypothetical protein
MRLCGWRRKFGIRRRRRVSYDKVGCGLNCRYGEAVEDSISETCRILKFHDDDT